MSFSFVLGIVVWKFVLIIFFPRQMLRELIPSDIMKMQSTSEWKRAIVASYNQDGGMSSEDAKVAFLKIVYRCVL